MGISDLSYGQTEDEAMGIVDPYSQFYNQAPTSVSIWLWGWLFFSAIVPALMILAALAWAVMPGEKWVFFSFWIDLAIYIGTAFAVSFVGMYVQRMPYRRWLKENRIITPRALRKRMKKGERFTIG